MPALSANACIAEFVGTFLLVFTVGCNVLTDNAVWGAVSIGAVLMVSIYSLGGASGGNFNPAVSFALGLADKMDDGWVQVLAYCAVQFIAGLVAALCYGSMFGAGFALAPKPGFLAGALICEVLYTFMLCFVVLNTAASKKTAGNQFYGLAIGFVIIAGGYGAGALGAGCFNPAVALAITASGFFEGSKVCLGYILAELFGAALAVGCFWVVRPEEKKKNGKAPAEYEWTQKVVAETIGTFILVLTVGLNVLGKSPAAAFSIAASLTCMICALGDISGGHFNPAVTTALFFSGKSGMSGKEACFYALAQIGGAIFAGLTYSGAHGGETFPLGPGESFGWSQCLTAEAVFTFVLCMTVLCVALQDAKTQPSQYVAFIIGSCVTAGGYAAGPVSGGSLNPAVSCGIAGAHLINGGYFYKAIIYSIPEVLGGLAAAGLYRTLYTDAFGPNPQASRKQAPVPGGPSVENF